MRVPVEWLREYVEVAPGTSGADIAAALVRVGLEEEGLHGADITGPLVVGRVISADPEPQKNGKTINWCQVDVGDANGTGEPQGIVCGAHNFAAGDWVVCVLPGGVLPGDFQIAARKTYGHVSAGMICAADELGLSDDGSGGIIRLAELLPGADLVPGQDAVDLLGLDRETVEINVTPDRGYCFSLRGVAREYSHATGAAFTDPVPALAQRAPHGGDTGFPVRLDDRAPLRGQAGCRRYLTRTVRGIDQGAPTPAWMATRLTEAGMRPISLTVDISNYVMLALGQPTHTFDLATISGPIVVRRAAAGETLKTLDDQERTLFTEDLLITDGGDRVLGIAGVMGGADTEISQTTTDVLIEAANFDPVSIARSARRHKLPSEAARRFERGVDIELAPAAAQLIVDLLVKYAGGVADEGTTDAGDGRAPVSIDLDLALPTRLVGVAYDEDQVVGVLRQIGCTVEVSGARARVVPPTWRPDLTTGPDLVEEVARIHGYDAIPSVVPRPPGGRGLTRGQQTRRVVAELLAGRGLQETWSAPFISAQVLQRLGIDDADPRRQAVRIANPLSQEADLFRTTLLPGLLDTLRRNVSRGARDLALFEVGLVALPDGQGRKAPTEEPGIRPDDATLARIRAAVPPQPRQLAFALTGERDRTAWWGVGRGADWSDALEIVRDLGQALGLALATTAAERSPFHPGRCAVVTVPDGRTAGWVGEVHPKVCEALELPARTVAGELDLDVLLAASEGNTVSAPVSTYPMASSDVALVVDETVPAADVEAALREGAGEHLEAAALFDLYSGEQVGEGRKSLAYRLQFRAPDRTLTTTEVNAARDRAVSRAEQTTGAIQRGA